MKRLRAAVESPPEELRRLPDTDQLATRWVDPQDPDNVTRAFYRWVDARRDWAGEHGLTVREAFPVGAA